MRTLITLLLLVSSVAVSARHVSYDEAVNEAEKFLNRPLTKSDKTSLKTNAVTNVDEKAIYVFNADDNAGFVIVSADDRAPMILGFADTGHLDINNLPPQLAAIIDNYEKQLNSLPETGSVHYSWISTATENETKEVLLSTVNWGQGAPYNSLCPTFGSGNAPTGCVATAMAIVMKYNEWPQKYNWSSMPVENISESDMGDLPALMKDAGEAVYMEYGPLESGANMNWVGHRLQQVFKYSPDCQYITAKNFSAEEWINMLRENIDNRQPVIYSGTGTGAHAFIIDGYKDNLYHINWGWDGSCNGYFMLNNLSPNETQHFSENSGMVINIMPDRSGKQYSECFCDYGYFWALAGYNVAMNIDIEEIKTGTPFTIVNSLISLPAGFTGYIGVGLVSENDEIKQVVGKKRNTTWSDVDNDYVLMGTNFDATGVAFDIPVESTDRIQLVSSDDREKDYKLILGTKEYASSKSVKNIVPDLSRIHWSFGEGLTAQYNSTPGGGGWTTVENNQELALLKGSKLDIGISSDENLPDGFINLQIEGPQINGNVNVSESSHWLGYPIELYGDYKISAKFVQLVDKEVNLTEAGTLNQRIRKEEATSIGNLKITGLMNAVDFWYIRDNMASLKTLDLSQISIEEVEAEDARFSPGGVTRQPADAIPEWGLTDLRNLRSLTLPEALKTICNNSMMNLNLQRIVIPGGVNDIGVNVFFDNHELEVVELRNPEPVNILECIFEGTKCPEGGILYVPKGSKTAYENVEVWKSFGQIIEGQSPTNLFPEVIVDNLKYRIRGESASLIGYTGEPVDITIPAEIEYEANRYKVTSIGESAFENCNSLNSVKMTENIHTIGSNAFTGCFGLKEVNLSSKISVIPQFCFYNTPELNGIDLTNIKAIGNGAFGDSGIKSIYIPEGTAPDNSASCFYNNKRLTEYIVADENPYFKSINGILYNTTQGKLRLEAIPCLYNDDIVIAEGTDEILDNSIGAISKEIGSLIFPSSVKEFTYHSISFNSGRMHIVLPPDAYYRDNAIYSNEGLEAITLSARPLSFDATWVNECPNLKHIYLNTTEEIDLNGVFSDQFSDIAIYTPSTASNVSCPESFKIYVPGATSGNLSRARSNVTEMWEYALDKSNGRIKVAPAIDGINISKVTINGKDFTRADNHVYEYDPNVAELEVSVDFNLHNRQKLTSVYNKEFNAEMANTDLTSAITEITIDSNKPLDVYNISGVMIKKSCRITDVNNLPIGVYILKQGSTASKHIVK